MNRREFLKAAVLAGAAIALPACGRSQGGTAQVFLGAGELISGSTARLPFGLLDGHGMPLQGRRASVWVGEDVEGQKGRAGLSGPYEAPYRVFQHAREGEPEGFYAATVTIPDARIARVHVETDDGAGSTVFQPKKAASVLRVGDAAPAIRTPTVRAPGGVANLCTLEPMCGLHEVSLHEALRKGTTVVLSIASPKLCTSRMCGPVLEEVLQVRRNDPDVQYIHLEPYATDNTAKLSSAAEAWRIESEPWTFVISAHGKVAASFEGPVLASEITDALRTASA